VRPYRIYWRYAVAIPIVHLLGLLAFVPWLFSWTGVVLIIVGHHVFGLLGMTLGYHRLLAHRSFACSKRLERVLSLLGVCCLQDSPLRWVAMHHQHHQAADERSDPHSPRVSLLWAHVGWLMVENRAFSDTRFYERYAPDLWRDPFHRWLALDDRWFRVYIAHAVLLLVAGLAVGWATTGAYTEGVRFGLSVLVWGVFVRTVVQWHLTWSVNSLTHRWGYRNYETSDLSRNHWLVALLTHGEGWHNNHHGEPRNAAHGRRWWELDVTYRTIRLLEAAGLVANVVVRGATATTAPTAPK
jgi:stearoyl-CoA desaturase (delta-9 desaturase)